MSWFDNYAGGYDVYLMRLDPQGNEIWAHNGILIADRSLSWTMDYDLAVDAQDNAILVYNSDATGVLQIVASKISPTGQFLWGPQGLQLSLATSSDYLGPPCVAVTTDGYFAIAWMQNYSTIIQKLNAAGTPQWALGSVAETPLSGWYTPSDIVAAESGKFIVSFVKGGDYGTPQRIYSEKYSITGGRLWGTSPVAVTTLNSLQYGNFPSILYDGAGGALYSWYDVPNNAYQVHVQHLNSSGTALFPINGALGATTANRLRVSPSIAYDQAHNMTFMFWMETDLNQNPIGLYGQKFNGTGIRQWTDAGKLLVSLGGLQVSFITAVGYADGAMVFYFDRSGASYLKGFRVNASGAFVWMGSPILFCTRFTEKGDLDSAITPSGMVLLAWTDGALGNTEIYAQNVNPDGTMGMPIFLHGDLNCDGVVDGLDISAFVLAMIDSSGYATAYPGCRKSHADFNNNGTIDQADLTAFVQLLLEP